VQHPAAAVDVADPQVQHLRQAQAAGVGGARQQAVAVVGQGGKEAGDLLGAEDAGQGPGAAAVGNHRHDIGPSQGDAVEKAQAADDLVEGVPGNAVVTQVQLEGAEVLGGELVRGAAGVAGELDDGGDVGLNGFGGVVADAQVVTQALAKRCHGGAARSTRGRRPSP
jgi:hypothetical protein